MSRRYVIYLQGYTPRSFRECMYLINFYFRECQFLHRDIVHETSLPVTFNSLYSHDNGNHPQCSFDILLLSCVSEASLSGV